VEVVVVALGLVVIDSTVSKFYDWNKVIIVARASIRIRNTELLEDNHIFRGNNN
jgi:hypothetical protein